MDNPEVPPTPEKESTRPEGMSPLTYEETPIIEPVKEPIKESKEPSSESSVFSDKDMSAYGPVKKSGGLGIIKVIVIFIIVFLIGYWLSGIIRQYINKPNSSEVTTEVTPTPMETDGTQEEVTASNVIATRVGWKTYQILVASTRQPYPNVSFQLPSEVLAPVCDGTSCASQGTYLPGGSRFTVALRGKGQSLPDSRGKLISDISGKTFVVKETTIHGNAATEFTGSFTGGTVGGYAFSNMHGYMIDVGDQVSLELNHFTPSGIKADFASDDTLFATIVDSVSALGMEKGGVTSVTTTSPTATMTTSPASTTSAVGQIETCQKTGTTSSMLYAEAVGLAMKSDCAVQGKLKTTHICNNTTGTWWIDLDVTKAGCAPACVVDVVTKTATVNWRCTGLSQ